MDEKPLGVMLNPTANPFSCKPRRTRSILRRWPGGNVIPRIRKIPRCEFRADSTISSTVEQKVMSPDFMKRAIVLALENVRSGSGVPFAAVIVKADRIISEGANRVTLTNDPTAHAEGVALPQPSPVLPSFPLRPSEP